MKINSDRILPTILFSAICLLAVAGLSDSTFAAKLERFPRSGDPFGEIPPILMLTTPPNGASGVATNSPVIFTFSEAMSSSQAITWSANVTAANFDYTWSPGNQTLVCNYKGGLPPNSLITWTLDPAVFKDTSGTPLFDFNNTGSFTTGAGGGPGPNPDPCTSTNANTVGDGGSFSITKAVNYVQSSTNPPIIDPDAGAFFAISVSSPTNNPVTNVTVQAPNGTTFTLTNNPFLPRFFFLFEQFNSQSALDAAHPNGSYSVAIKRQNGNTASATLAIPLAANPPTPTIANFTQTQGFNPATDFTLRWQPFSGATTTDSIFLSLQDESRHSFYAPDLCVPRDLKVTDTSILIPKNTFATSNLVNGSLTFTKGGGFDTNSISDIVGFAAYSKTTTFETRAAGTGTQPPPIQFTNLSRSTNGMFNLSFTGQAGVNYTIEASTDLVIWTPLLTTNSPTGIIQFSDAGSTGLPYRFYRVRQNVAGGLQR